ncbi:hypothetical protein EG329_010932 [Mollisiaceae sp. DMI_Dod_QoI]|nr:hypothetical protein EG329_010932 [Helotiales sp. DMI_Dod_QoI]
MADEIAEQLASLQTTDAAATEDVTDTTADPSSQVSDLENLQYRNPIQLSSRKLRITDGFDPEGTDPSTAKPFTYSPIISPNQLRVLFIRPGEGPDSPLECLMVHSELSKAQYQALSYTWGDPSKTRTLLCNGLALAVTENLYDALVDIRECGNRKAISPVWADAICINQADLKERETQVKMMREIYQRAIVTVVWLGGTHEQSKKVFDTVDLLHEACQYPDFQKLLQRDELDFSVLDHLSIGDTKLQIPWDNRKELGLFFSHPWFERIWICQEVAVSGETFVFYGGRIRPWSHCISTAYCMQQLHWGHEGVDLDEAFHINALQIEGYRLGFTDSAGLGLLELLSASRKFRSSEPLDRVFGLYGLLGDVKEREIVESVFEYRFCPLEVFHSITLNLIISDQTLDVLHLANNDLESEDSWPSFIPNFALHNTGRQMGSRKGRGEWEYHAAGDTLPRMKIDGIVPNKDTTFRTEPTSQVSFSGFIVDKIGRIGTEMYDMGFNYGAFLKDWFMLALMDEGAIFYTAEEFHEAQEYQKALSAAQPSQQQPLLNEQGDERAVAGSSSKLLERVDSDLLKIVQQLEDSKTDQSESSDDIQDVKPSSDDDFEPSYQYPIPGISPGSAFWRTLIRNRDGSGSIPDDAIAETHFQPWMRACFNGMSAYLAAWYKDHHAVGPRPVPTFNDWVDRASLGSRMFRGEKNFLGTGSRYVQPGDLICVLYGGQTPFVLREVEEGRMRFVGDCYVHGIMEGEALDLGLETVDFVMV